jgi:hypothetical protein
MCRVTHARVQVLHEVAEKGFEQEQLMAIMHQVFVSALSLVVTRRRFFSL